MAGKSSHSKPVEIHFPSGVPDALACIASKTGMPEQVTAFYLWQFYKRLKKNIIEKHGKLQAADFLVPMSSTVLREKLRSKDGYAKHIQALVDHGVLRCAVGHDSRLNKSRQYSLTERFNPLGKQEKYVLDQPTVLNAFFRAKHQPDDFYFQRRQLYLKAFDIDVEAALQWASTEGIATREKDADLWIANVMHHVEMIAAGHRPLIKDQTAGREHHPFIWIPRHIRKHHVTYRKSKLVQLDMPSAQPLLLYAELRKRSPTHPELEKFKQALKEDFYLFMADAWHRHFYTPTPPRKWVKSEFWRFFFGPTRPDLEPFQLFQHEFPALYKAIAASKRRKNPTEKKPHSILAKILQQAESDLIFSVCKKLTDEGLEPFFTVHDCLTTIPENSGKTDEIMLEALEMEGIDWLSTLRKE